MSVHKRRYKKKDGSISFYYLAVVKSKGIKTATKQFARKIDAETWEREKRVLLKTDPDGRKDTEIAAFEALSDYWMEHVARKRLEYSSVNRYEGILRNYLLPKFRDLKLNQICPHAVEAWLHELRNVNGLAAKSVNCCLSLLRKMLTDAVHWKWIRQHPIAGVSSLREDEREFDFWDVHEAKEFLFKVLNLDPPLYFATSLALYTGMRLGEIQALKWDCVDLESRQITVKRTYCDKEAKVKERTKTKKIRRLPVNDSLSEILVELKNRSDSMFVLPDFSYHHAARILKRAAKELGVKPIRFHDLRHSFASNFVMCGGELYKLQRLLGHSSIQMTERYSHLSPGHLKDATAILDFGTRDKGAEVIAIHG